MSIIDYGVHIPTTFQIVKYSLDIYSYIGIAILGLRIRHMSTSIKHKAVV